MSSKLSSPPSFKNLPMAVLIDAAKETWERTEVEADVAKAGLKKAKKNFKRAKKAAKKARRALEALVSEAGKVELAPTSKPRKVVAKKRSSRAAAAKRPLKVENPVQPASLAEGQGS